MTPEELETAILAGDSKRCLDLLAGATESQRRAAAPTALRWRKIVCEQMMRFDGTWDERLPKGMESSCLDETSGAALLGTATLSELKSLGWRAANADTHAFEVLSARQPEWLPAWAAWILEESTYHWTVVRRFVRAGLCPRPDSDAYILGILAHAWRSRSSPRELLEEDPDLLEQEVWRLFEVEGGGEDSLAARDKFGRERSWSQVLADLGNEGRLSRDRLLDASLDALERDFAQFRAGWFSRFHEALSPTLDERAARMGRYLALLGSRIPPTVSFALKALAALDKADRLPPGPVVDQIAPALRAREKGAVTQALRLLDRAVRRDPSLAARAAEVAAKALTHESPEVQGAALDFIERHARPPGPELADLLRARQEDVAPSQRPRLLALLDYTKGERGKAKGEKGEAVVSGQWSVVSGGQGPGAGGRGEAGSAAVGSGQVLNAQGSTLNTPTPERLNALPPDLRQLAGVDAALQAVQQGTLDLPALDLRDLRIPRLDPAAALTPVGHLDELIELFSTVLENEEPPEDVERVLDGVSRLCAERPPDWEKRIAPLRKRAATLSRRGWGPAEGEPGRDLGDIALAWATGEVQTGYSRQDECLSFGCFLDARAREVAGRAAARKPAPLLAAPTHRGWIDPRVLVARLKELQAAGQQPDRLDAIQALLRLAPDHRADALALAGDLQGEVGEAVRHALGAARKEPEIGPSAGLWVAAARARAPHRDDAAVEARHPRLGPDAGRAAQTRIVPHAQTVASNDVRDLIYYWYTLETDPPLPEKLSADLPTVLLYAGMDGQYHETPEPPAFRWAATIWPGSREGWCGRGVACIGDNLDWAEANWGHQVFLEPLLDPDTHLGPVARLLHGATLGSKMPGEKSLAIDILIAAVDDGRITGPALGDTLATLVDLHLGRPARWAKTLAEAARVSPLHAETVRAGVEGALHGEPSLRPADLAPFLELLHELCVQSGAAITYPEARAYLGEVKGGGKAAKLAKTLLALEGREDEKSRRAAMERALVGRVERAERWSRMLTAVAESEKERT
jgi:tetratricopeptide (TPR) repeat protein